VIQHIVLVKWKSDTTEQQIVEAFNQAATLVDRIEPVRSITLGRDRGESAHGFTHAIIVSLDDESALRRYLQDPVRLDYVDRWMRPLEEQRIEIDVPVDISHRQPVRRNWQWGSSVGMGIGAALDD
jgi:hypothetical protein